MEAFVRRVVVALSLAYLCVILQQQSVAATLRVPTDRPTIQGAIDAAVDGDVIAVAAGMYKENIDYHGKAVAVISDSGPQTTVIDGNASGSVVVFNAGEQRSSVLDGFTIQNGRSLQGGGIFVRLASPLIRNNIIANNFASLGGGLMLVAASPLLQSNTITKNQVFAGGNEGGGGILIEGGGESAAIVDNIITENVSGGDGYGGGIFINGCGHMLIARNVITKNTSYSVGGGIGTFNHCEAVIADNLIAGNTALTTLGGYGIGGGIYLTPPNDFSGAKLYNNTIADNDGAECSGLYIEGFKSQTEVVNNIIVSLPHQPAVMVTDVFSPVLPVFRSNNVFTPKGPAYDGYMQDQTGLSGNISSNPLFRDPGTADYHFGPGSPCLDSGDNSVVGSLTTDLDGNPRIVDGKSDGKAVVDLGAYEKQPPVILSVSVDQKNLVLTGKGFDGGTVVLMNGVQRKTLHVLANPTTELIAKNLLKQISPGSMVELQVRDSDDCLSASFPFVRP